MKRKIRKESKGITLIALVITIIVLLILAGVAIVTLTGDNGILTQAGKAKTENKKAEKEEQVNLAKMASYDEDGKFDYSKYQANLKNIEGITGVPDTITEGSFPLTVTLNGEEIKIFEDGTIFYSGEWDITATPEDCFYWASDDPNDEGYGTVISYTSKIENYTKLRFPSRCTKITFSVNYTDEVTNKSSREVTNNILEVEIPETVNSIGDYTFGEPYNQSFKKLKKVVIEYGTKSIGRGAFDSCTSLTNVEIPSSVTSIGDVAFEGCTSLSSITIPDNLTSLGYGAFINTAWYNNQPDGVVYVGKVLYSYKGTMPSNTNIQIKEGTTMIVDSAFSGCKNLSSVEIPSSVTSIGGSAFSRCTSLNSITIPSSVTSIGWGAFSNCTSLNSIEIPSSVTSMSGWVFDNWNSSQTIKIQGYSSAPTGWSDDWNYQCSAQINWNQ